MLAPRSRKSKPRDSDAFRLRSAHRFNEVVGRRYRILGYMDSGGTADVFLGQDLETEATVVIKQLTTEMANNHEIRERFLLEATAAKAIDHENVVKVTSVIESQNQPPFLTMEALDGETLGEYLRREGSMPLSTALEFMRQAVLALAATHDAGVIHRDVKPDNLFLLGKQGAPKSLKLIDFGMAKLKHATPTTNPVVLGTAQYMAPEQILVEHVDARTDIYGLGVVMFRTITGHLPFESEPTTEMLRHHVFSTPPPASWLQEELDPWVEDILLRAMRKHPENRYQSMAELLIDVDAALADNRPARRAMPLKVTPDTYVPSSDEGREVIRLMAKTFGQFAPLEPAPGVS
jgi:serine/threonine-protein kinase